MRVAGTESIRKLLQQRLATRHEDEHFGSWRDLKSKFFAQAG
jgi:hypothetical protein